MWKSFSGYVRLFITYDFSNPALYTGSGLGLSCGRDTSPKIIVKSWRRFGRER